MLCRGDPKEALQDFLTRLRNYEKAYEAVMEGSYIKLINMVSGSSGQMQVRLCTARCAVITSDGRISHQTHLKKDIAAERIADSSSFLKQ